MRLPKRTTVINLLVLTVTCIIVLLLLEWFLRFSGIERLESRRPHLHQPSAIPGVNYEFVPNLKSVRGYNWERVSTNSFGLRGPEADPAKGKNIAIIGDSFAFGFGVNDHEVHADLLRQAFPEVNVLNMGVNGYNIEQQVRAYQAKFTDLHPQLVIVEFVWNDMDPPSILTDERRAQVYALQGYQEQGTIADAKLERSITASGTLRLPFKLWLQKHSAIFNFIEHRTKWLPFRRQETNYFAEHISADDLAFYEKWLDALDQHLTGSRKLFVIWPENALHLEVRRELRRMAEERGFVVLDLYDVFGMRYPHLSWDWHPNAAAHRTVADVLIQAIHHYRLLDTAPEPTTGVNTGE